MSRGWLIVFAKAPRPGLVKTRMSPPLSLDQCAELYESMLADVLATSADIAQSLDLLPVLAFHPPEAVAELMSHTPAGFRLQVQRGADLGERMANAFAEASAAGATRILLRGSDSPALAPSMIEDALHRLDSGDDLVLTPDQSGGYVMIGMKTPQSALFDVAMSTQDMREQTLQIADSLGLRSSMTEASFDLDTADDLRSLNAQTSAQSLDLCQRTVESIASLQLDIVL